MAALILALADPTAGSFISLALTGVVTILRRLKEAFKGNQEHLVSIQLKSDTIERLLEYVKKYWPTKKKDKDLLEECINNVKGDLEKLLENVGTKYVWKVVLGICPSIKVQLDSLGSKLQELIQNIEVRQVTQFNQLETLRQFRDVHKQRVKRLRQDLANKLAADKFKQVELLTKKEYENHVKLGVYDANPRTKFPCTIYMSSSVPGCTKLILDFLRKSHEDAKLLTRDSSKLVGEYLVELLTNVLPQELKKSLDLRRSRLSAHDASLFNANIKKLRSSLDNPEFSKIRRNCRVQVKSLWDSNWTTWEEVVRESEHIKAKLKPHGQQLGQNHIQHQQHHRQHGQHHPQRHELQQPQQHPQHHRQHGQHHPQRHELQHPQHHMQHGQHHPQHGQHHPQRYELQQPQQHPQHHRQHGQHHPQRHELQHPQHHMQHGQHHPQRHELQQPQQHPQVIIVNICT